LRHINISLLWVQEQEKLKKLVYEKVPGQDNPADLFTKGVGREKLQQFAWASGQVFLDGRAEAGLQVQGAGLLTVGIGSVPRGSLCVSSGSGNSVNPASKQRAPNVTNKQETQHKSKNSELAHAKIGKMYCLTNVYRPRAIRTIGETQPSCVKPDSYQNPRRNCRGGAVGNMLISAHAQFGGWAGENPNVCTYNYTDVSADVTWSSCDYDQYGSCWNKLKGYVHTSVPAPFGKWGDAHSSVHAQSEKWDRTNQHGEMSRRERLGQCNFGIPRPLKKIRWQHVQGGVVSPGCEHGQWDLGVTAVRDVSSVIQWL